MAQTKEKWWWPPVHDLSEAETASNKGVWAAGIVSALTFVFATISLFIPADALQIDAWTFVDAGFYALIAWGISRRSRVFAVFGLLLFIADKIIQLAAFGLGMIGLGIAGFFVVLFLVGIKGTFAYHKFKTKTELKPTGAGNPDPSTY